MRVRETSGQASELVKEIKREKIRYFPIDIFLSNSRNIDIRETCVTLYFVFSTDTRKLSS